MHEERLPSFALIIQRLSLLAALAGCSATGGKLMTAMDARGGDGGSSSSDADRIRPAAAADATVDLAADTPALEHDAPPMTRDGRDAGGVANSVQRSCVGTAAEPGCGLVEVPGGSFTMGLGTANPVPVRVGPFALDSYEVTIARFRRFWEAGRPAPAEPVIYPNGAALWRGDPVRDPNAHGQGPWGSRPIQGPSPRPFAPIGLDWWTAMSFCVWDGGRLPTEAEWELAAGHLPDGRPVPRRYPWGNEPPQGGPNLGCDRARWNDCPGERVVGAFAATGGFYDLAGGVSEWTADGWARFTDATCWGGSPLVNPLCLDSPGGFAERVVRGGHFSSRQASQLEVASRYVSGEHSTLDWFGVRCARTRSAP